MTAEQVLLRKDAAPFVPFEMLLADGRALLIPHPDFLTVAEDEELAHVHELNGEIEMIDLLLDVSIRFPARTQAEAMQ